MPCSTFEIYLCIVYVALIKSGCVLNILVISPADDAEDNLTSLNGNDDADADELFEGDCDCDCDCDDNGDGNDVPCTCACVNVKHIESSSSDDCK